MNQQTVVTGDFRVEDINIFNPDLEKLIRALENEINHNNNHYYFIGFEDQLNEDEEELLDLVKKFKLSHEIVNNMLAVEVKSSHDLRNVITIWACYSGGAELYALVRSRFSKELFLNDLQLFLSEGSFKNSKIIAKDAGDGDTNLFVIFHGKDFK